MHTGKDLITKAKHDLAELQNCYMSLLTNDVVRSYPNIGSCKTWEQFQETFRLPMWQERCRTAKREFEGCREGTQRCSVTAQIL
jgi:hypothetical protein